MSEVKITFPDKSVRSYEAGVTPMAIAQSISRGLSEKCLVAEVNGKQLDLSTPITDNSEIKLFTADSSEGMNTFWHSSAHVMAQAVKRLWPEAKFEDGPPTEAGFFYDIFLTHKISSEDFPKIEAEMEKIAKEKFSFSRKELSRTEAIELFSSIGQDFKIDIIKNVPEGAVISSYTQGEFTDLCRGPHVPNTSYLKAFKIMSVAGAFFKGDENNIQLQRLRAISFPSKKLLDEYLVLLEEAKKRDHRKLGQELELFHITPKVGGGLPLWLPNGTVIRETLIDFLREEQRKIGYSGVVTPNIGSLELYKTSGHYPYYKDSQYPPLTLGDGEQYLLKPMNCPHHHQIYDSKPRSYKELPVRLSEFGTVYRYEQSGELNGLSRVRGFTVDDAHIYCRHDQLKDEIKSVIGLTQLVFKSFKMNVSIRLSFRDDNDAKYGGEKSNWDQAQRELQEVADEMGLDYFIGLGEAAFYGPKIDFIVKDALGRKWQLGTVQVDYVMPERFKLEYIGSDGQKHRPVIIHRAPFGSLERFLSLLIEHFAGNFPVWIAPVQVAILPISDSHIAYAEALKAKLLSQKIRVQIDTRNEKIGYKIREAEVKKIPYILVLGDKEVQNGSIAIRRHGKGDQGTKPVDEFMTMIIDQIVTRSLE